MRIFGGRFYRGKFPKAAFVLPLCIGIGLAAAVLEIIRAVKLALKIERKL